MQTGQATKPKRDMDSTKEVNLSPTQIKLLEMGEDDVRNGRIISEKELERKDADLFS
jgi:hypothetical protein